MRAAVVGHVEWVRFADVERVPSAGEIIHARESWIEPAGGGAVAAVRLRELAGRCDFLTAIGNDEPGRLALEALRALDLRVHAGTREEPHRQAFTFLSDDGERTITLLGPKLVPYRSDPLPWDELAQIDAVYFTGGDPDALRAARQARVLVATARELPTLQKAGVELDALVHSGTDSAELPAPLADAYGAGDSFAAGLTFALGRNESVQEALAFAARCGAAAMTIR